MDRSTPVSESEVERLALEIAKKLKVDLRVVVVIKVRRPHDQLPSLFFEGHRLLITEKALRYYSRAELSFGIANALARDANRLHPVMLLSTLPLLIGTAGLIGLTVRTELTSPSFYLLLGMAILGLVFIQFRLLMMLFDRYERGADVQALELFPDLEVAREYVEKLADALSPRPSHMTSILCGPARKRRMRILKGAAALCRIYDPDEAQPVMSEDIRI